MNVWVNKVCDLLPTVNVGFLRGINDTVHFDRNEGICRVWVPSVTVCLFSVFFNKLDNSDNLKHELWWIHSMQSMSAHMCFLWSAAALILPPSWGVVYIRLDNVCYIKHPLQVKVWDHMPPKPVHISIMHPKGRKHWPGLEEKGFLRPFPL